MLSLQKWLHSKFPNFMLYMLKNKQQRKRTAKTVSFEWSHYRILSTDSKVRTELHNSIISLEVSVTLNNRCNFIMTEHCV